MSKSEVKLLSVGCDPEFFLRDKDGGLVSAYGLIPGTKAEPCPVDSGSVQVDGMATEIGIHPATTRDEFVTRIATVTKELEGMLPEYTLCAESSVEFSKELMATQPKEATELGCEADYNAYSGEQNPAPDAKTRVRGGGGHIHFGWWDDMVDPLDVNHYESCRILVRELDYFLGVPLAMFELENEASRNRRKHYGSFGAFRPKPYGCEYRSPSNVWLTDPELIGWVYDISHYVFNQLLSGVSHNQINEDSLQLVISGGSNTKIFHYAQIQKRLEGTGIPMPKCMSDLFSVQTDRYKDKVLGVLVDEFGS